MLRVLNERPVVVKQEEKPLSPMLLIGLGGTGKEVLLRFRRLMVERFGSLEAMPSVQCRHFDTDQTSTAKTIYDNVEDPLFEKVRFSDAETQPLTIPGGIQPYVRYIDRHPNIRQWLQTKGSFAELGELGEGAGQVRMASRLGLYHNFPQIAAALNQARGRLQSPDVAKSVADWGFQFDAKELNIFIIASLAGGTGSGTFLDFGFLTHKIFPEATRVGILFLPSLFAGYSGCERIKANGYAALMELNHYSFTNPFLCNWDGSQREHSYLPPPPFSYTYLVDGANQAGYSIGSQGNEFALYQMQAESLFLEYWEGRLAGRKRATRVNLAQYTQNVYYHNYWETGGGETENFQRIEGDTYPMRFGSNGQSQIFFPADRLHNACAARLAAAVIGRWETAGLGDPLRSLFREFLLKKGILFCQLENYEGETRRDLNRALMLCEGGQTYLDRFRESVLQVRSQALSTPLGGKGSVVWGFLNTVDSQMGEDEDSPTAMGWGPWVRAVEQNLQAWLGSLLGKEGSLEKGAAAMTEDPRFGVAFTLEMLLQLKGILGRGAGADVFKYKAHFEEMLAYYDREVGVRKARVDLLLHDMEREERTWYLFGRKEVVHRQIELLTGTEEAGGHLYAWVEARFLRQVAKRGIRAVEKVDEYLGKPDRTGSGMLGRYYGILGGFGELRSRFNARAEYFKRERTYTHTLNLYRPGDDEAWYRHWTGGPEGEEARIKDCADGILKDVFRVDSPSRALQIIQSTPAGEIEDAMILRCKKVFSGHPDQPDALELLMDPERFTESARRETVQQAYKMSRFWLKMAAAGLEHVGGVKLQEGQQLLLVGLDTVNGPRQEAFRRMLDDIRMDVKYQFVDIGHRNRSAIVFYNELQGVPLFYPESVVSIGGLREAYIKHYTASDAARQLDLHTDRDRFGFADIFPKSDAEVEGYRQAIRAFVLARVLGLFVAAGDDDETRFTFPYEEDFTVNRMLLGTEGDAIYRLANIRGAEGLRNRLMKAVEERLARLQGERRLDVYLLLLEFYQTQVYPRRQDREGDVDFIRFSPQDAILESEKARVMRELCATPAAREQLHTAFLQLRGKPRDKELGLEEYRKVLSPWTVPCGKFTMQVRDSFSVVKAVAETALVLDIDRFTAAAPVAPAPEALTRPCPVCGKTIHVRAVFCLHCQRQVASHVRCLNPNCQDDKVPDDSTVCPTCGHRQVRAEMVQCQTCFEATGEKGTPCPRCGTTFGQTLPAVAPLAAPAAPPLPAPPSPSAGPVPATASAPPAPGPAGTGANGESAEMVECPSCTEMTLRGRKCPGCGLLVQ